MRHRSSPVGHPIAAHVGERRFERACPLATSLADAAMPSCSAVASSVDAACRTHRAARWYATRQHITQLSAHAIARVRKDATPLPGCSTRPSTKPVPDCAAASSVQSQAWRHRPTAIRRAPHPAADALFGSVAPGSRPFASSTPSAWRRTHLDQQGSFHRTHGQDTPPKRRRLRTPSPAARQARRHEWSRMRAFELPDRHDAVS